MPDSQHDVEWIVREVVRRLLERGVEVPANGHASAQTADGGVLTLPDRVVSLATIADRLAGVRQVVVSAKAVVTPAVRDELRARQIELIRK